MVSIAATQKRGRAMRGLDERLRRFQLVGVFKDFEKPKKLVVGEDSWMNRARFNHFRNRLAGV